MESGGTVYQDSLNCFAQGSGEYLNLVNTRTTWVNDFTRFWLPTYHAYNWLSPYNGNAHNRSFFTQLVLYVVTKAKHRHNRNWMPDIYELFVGTGQIFMGATAFADLLLEEPPFDAVGSGDLNRHLIAAYEALKLPGLVDEYLAAADQLDTLLQLEIDEYFAAAGRQGSPRSGNRSSSRSSSRRSTASSPRKATGQRSGCATSGWSTGVCAARLWPPTVAWFARSTGR